VTNAGSTRTLLTPRVTGFLHAIPRTIVDDPTRHDTCDAPVVARLHAVLGLALIAFVAPACGAPAAGEGEATSTSAYTVEGGDKFVISATPEEVVLSKKVGEIAFPFDAVALRGKALLIHPVHGKADGGVYIRAQSVKDDLDRLVVSGAPLTFEEMEHITEDDIVRIYIDRARPEAQSAFDLPVSGLQRSSTPLLGVTVAHEVEKAKLAPTPLVKWTEQDGLELGLRLDFEWKSKLVARGEHGGEIFRSPTLESAPYVVLVPIGPAPVPVTFTASTFVSCSASVSGMFDASFVFSAEASIAASVRIKNGSIERGSWPATASGTANVEPKFETRERMAMACTIPRIELRAAIASVAGAYVAVVPAAEVSTDNGPSFEAALFAGVDARLFGFTVAKEVKLYSWKPL
jgi:hypothetical protein